jgi:DNA-binding Lrp family transcriptional regulator
MVHVNMMVKNRQTVAAFEAGVLGLSEVVECRRMFGDPDYLLSVALPDTTAYERFYMTRLLELPGIGRASSQFTMKVVKRA